jgi:hypothetical protein
VSDVNVTRSASVRIENEGGCRGHSWLVFSLAAGLLLVSCGGEAKLVGPAVSQPVATAPAVPSPGATPATPVAAATPEAPIGPVVWTTAVDPLTSAPTDSVTSYRPDTQRIIAAAPLRRVPAGSALAASWFYNDTSLDAFNTQLAMTAAADQTWVSFYIERSNDTLWPEGVYEIAISLGGMDAQRGAIEVIAAE